MEAVQELLNTHVRDGQLPGAVAAVGPAARTEVHCAGHLDIEDSAPMEPDTIFRIASITKPITAAAAMVLVDEGRIGLDEPLTGWLPELAGPQVVRTPSSPVDDVVPAHRDLILDDLLTLRCGWGFPRDFSLPAVEALFGVEKDGRFPQLFSPPDQWLAELGAVPMVARPGEAFLYATGPNILGVLIARIAGQGLGDFMAERLLDPLGMVDTGFAVPAASLHRLAAAYDPDEAGTLEDTSRPDLWSEPPAFESGGGGLVGTAGDWVRFGRMLLAGGEHEGRRILSAGAVTQMLTNHLSPGQIAPAELFLEGEGWGFGGSVDIDERQPWNVPGRYGWVGGTGTTAHITPATGAVAVLMTQVAMVSPEPTPLMREFWTIARRG